VLLSMLPAAEAGASLLSLLMVMLDGLLVCGGMSGP
jgi:hypothetical protein